MVRFRPAQSCQQKRPKEMHRPRGTRQMTQNFHFWPHGLMPTTRTLKRNRNISIARMPGFWTRTHMIGEGCADWEKCDAMTCDHGDPCKELRHPDPASTPLDYMKHWGVFKAKKSSEYDLCHFYHVELSRDLPTFPSPCEPAICEMLEDFLLKARALGHPNLIVAFAQDLATAVCLLQKLHSKDSLRHLPIELKSDAGGKATKKFSFCLYPAATTCCT